MISYFAFRVSSFRILYSTRVSDFSSSSGVSEWLS